MIVSKFQGRFPSDALVLESISGIGHYTAGAVRNFAFDLPTTCIDTNIRRILHRAFFGLENRDGSWKVTDVRLLSILDSVLAEALSIGWQPKDFFAALMDFGSLVCTKSDPKWHLMPLKMRSMFKAYGKSIPVAKKVLSKEQGREVAGRFIPNRIFRGRIVDVLRSEEKGLTLDQIGSHITIDWSLGDHREWLGALLQKLVKDQQIEQRGQRWQLVQ